MLILASQSPRRRELLTQLGVKFSQRSVDIDETPYQGEAPSQYVIRMAEEKAIAGWQRENTNSVVLGSDTSVIAQGEILGKPKNKADAVRMLTMLSDTTHQVITAVAVKTCTLQKSVLVETDVTFGPLTEQCIDWYWQTGEPQDKAGSYGIQGLGGQFVKQIKGSYSAVVGLPLYETKLLLKEIGIVNEC